MINKYIVILILFVVCSCSNFKKQKIIINNEKKTISLQDSTFVIDSICIRKFKDTYFSTVLINKSKGSSELGMDSSNEGYKIYSNKLSKIPCNDENLVILVIIRKRGNATKVTEEIALNFEKNEFIQASYAKYFLCSNPIDTLETSFPGWK